MVGKNLNFQLGNLLIGFVLGFFNDLEKFARVDFSTNIKKLFEELLNKKFFCS